MTGRVEQRDEWPIMKILFRYLLRECAKIFGMCFAALMTIYLVIDFFEKVRQFIGYDASWLDVLTYFVLKTPGISFQIAPLAILMATLLTIGVLSRGHEITAMRSCGISLPWIASPFLALAIGTALLLLLFSSTVIPLASNKAEEIRVIRIEKKPSSAALKVLQTWTRMGGDAIMHFSTVSIGGQSLGGVTLFHFDRQFRLIDMTEAEEAHYADGFWELRHGFKRSFLPDGAVMLKQFDRMPMPLTLIPVDFTTWLGMYLSG